MAERGYANITVKGIFKSRTLSAGDSGTSDVIDLREIAQNGFFSLVSSVVAGTAGTAGTTVFTYSGASSIDGKFVTPASAVAIGTNGTATTSSIFSFQPELMPFMKIIGTQTGAGTAGKDSVVTTDLIVQ
jgi:hypothetical protein